jgi:uncharacterized protein
MNPVELLRDTKVSVAPETFAIVSLTPDKWLALLADASLSPRMTAPFLIFKDRHEVTLVLDDADLRNMRPGLAEAQIANGYRLLTFETVLDLSVVGFMAAVSRLLAEAGVPILPVSAFSRDHILIRQTDLASALKALGPHVAELC